MGKIMTNIELINRMKELYNEPNFYGSGGSKWSSWQNGRGWYVDCTCSIKAILWGGRFIPDNRGKAHAGCNYNSNGVPDFTPQKAVEWTNATRGNFRNLVPGELLIMTSHGHAGLYIGGGNVLEVTPAWTGGTPGCQMSQIGANGERIKNGRQVLSWEYHGKIPVIDYISEPTPEPKPVPTPSGNFEIGDEVILNGPIYVSSTASNPANYIYNKITKITRKVNGAHPYNTTGDLGWMDESSIRKAEEPKPQPKPQPEPQPTPQPTGLQVGDRVKITGTGNGSSYGDSNTAYGIGWERQILKIWSGRPFPYQVGNSTGTTGFYKESSLQKL